MINSSIDKRLAVQEALELQASRYFFRWLNAYNASLLVTSYHAHKLLTISTTNELKPFVLARNIPRCLGLAIENNNNGFYVSSQHQIMHLVNSLKEGDHYKDHDRLYLPQASYFTSDVDIHDMVVTANNQLVFVNTLYNCLSSLDAKYNFKVEWMPPFISKLAREDRCHLNGLALVDGEPRYVSAVSMTDVVNGWRAHKMQGGIIFDIKENKIVCQNLSMPHSPRWHLGKLWLLNAGTGQFGYIQENNFIPLTFCPGFLRGLNFIDHYAIVGLSNLRDTHLTNDTELSANLASKQVPAICGLYVIDLNTGDIAHYLEFKGWLQEIYDVGILSSTRLPYIVGFESDEINHFVSLRS